MTVKQLIEWAYDVTSMQVIGGPSWITEKQFEVDAKAEGAHTYKELRAMLQPLLAERFHLGIRRERRELPIYALTVSKGGLKLRSAQSGRPTGILLQSSVDPTMVRVVGQSVSMRYLASFLTGTLSSLVEDETGLDVSYDFAIDVPFSGALGKLEANAATVTEIGRAHV